MTLNILGRIFLMVETEAVKCLLGHHEDLRLIDAQNPCKKLNVVMHVCIPRVEEEETGGSLGLTGAPGQSQRSWVVFLRAIPKVVL